MAELTPQTREEHFLARIAGDSTALALEPVTRIEHFLQRIIDNGGPSPGPGGDVTAAAVLAAVEAMDETQAADALDALGGVPADQALTSDGKDALLDWLKKSVFTDDTGPTVYANLLAAFYPIQSISAVYTPSETVYTVDSVDSLKNDLVVTASYDGHDDSIIPANDYTLSGTLTAGTSVITVTYKGKTTTFDVTVEECIYVLREKDFARGLAATLEYGFFPHYCQDSSKRISYIYFDILLDGGKTYEIVATSTYQTAQMGLYGYNQIALDAVAAESHYSSANSVNSGWQALSYNWSVPANVNDSPFRGVRFSFRQSSAEPVLAADFAITKVVIKEVV